MVKYEEMPWFRGNVDQDVPEDPEDELPRGFWGGMKKVFRFLL
jgi:hypothetical protein